MITVFLLKSNYGVVDYDTYDGFVVRAESEQAARAIAQENGADEIREYRFSGTHRASHCYKDFWTNSEHSSCVPIDSAPDEKGVILSSFHAG